MDTIRISSTFFGILKKNLEIPGLSSEIPSNHAIPIKNSSQILPRMHLQGFLENIFFFPNSFTNFYWIFTEISSSIPPRLLITPKISSIISPGILTGISSAIPPGIIHWNLCRNPSRRFSTNYFWNSSRSPYTYSRDRSSGIFRNSSKNIF